MATDTPLRVFISYSHEGGQHADRVAALALLAIEDATLVSTT